VIDHIEWNMAAATNTGIGHADISHFARADA